MINIRDALDLLERAKALQEQLYDEPDESVGGNPCRYRKQLFDLIPELIAEVERLRSENERLEAAFLKAEKANLMHHMDADYADENAREALERIKEGGKDED